MRAHFGLPSVENDEMEGKPPITVKFEIPYFTVSGIQVCVFMLKFKNIKQNELLVLVLVRSISKQNIFILDLKCVRACLSSQNKYG